MLLNGFRGVGGEGVVFLRLLAMCLHIFWAPLPPFPFDGRGEGGFPCKWHGFGRSVGSVRFGRAGGCSWRMIAPTFIGFAFAFALHSHCILRFCRREQETNRCGLDILQEHFFTPILWLDIGPWDQNGGQSLSTHLLSPRFAPHLLLCFWEACSLVRASCSHLAGRIASVSKKGGGGLCLIYGLTEEHCGKSG